MNTFRLTALLAAAVGFVALVPEAHAGVVSRKTFLTISAPIDVAGHVLPAGSYVFMLLDDNTGEIRNIVRITNAQENQTYATVFANEAFRPYFSKKIFDYYETPANQPKMLKDWYWPDGNPIEGQYGLQFPRVKMTVASQNTQQAETTPPPAPAAPVIAENQTEQQSTVEEQPAPAPQQAAPEQPAPQVAENLPPAIPQTGSDLPLLALIGFGSLGLALGTSVLARQLN